MKKILIIDDDKIFIKTLGDSLPKEKYEVSSVSNGEEGLKELEKNTPDLIILDLVMPKMGGIEFLNVLKENNNGKNIPILISTQMSNVSDISEAITSGMQVGTIGYFVKASQDMDMIVKTIENTLKNKP